MDDKRLYQQILGLAEPWFVDRVSLELATQRVEVFVEHRADARWQCPQCGKVCPLHDHSPSRGWRHLDTCQLQTVLHARPPRVRCPEHGVVTVSLPWAEPNSHFTMLMESFIIDVLLHCRNVKSAAALARVSWDQCAGVMHRAVRRGLARRGEIAARQLGVDEKRYRRGHVYATVVCDLNTCGGAVLDVIEGNNSESLAAFYRGLSPSQLEAILNVVMDMHAPYVAATRQHVPGGGDKIIFDRFHIMGLTNAALERVRQGEHQELRSEGNRTLERARQMLLWADERRPAKYDEHMKRLQQQDLRTGKAWSMKENLRRLWNCSTIKEARRFFGGWYGWVIKSTIKPMQRLARSLAGKLTNIVRFCEHRLTTATNEGINSQISSAQHRAAGYRSFARLRIAILFFCGKLRLYP